MCFSINLESGRAIRLSFVNVVKPTQLSAIFIQSRQKAMRVTYLNPFSWYSAAAAIIMCADADLPAPDSRNCGSGLTLRMLPVNANTLGASAGSSLKPRTACWAATKTLVLLTAMSRLNASSGIANGSPGEENVAAPATKTLSIHSARSLGAKTYRCK